MTIDLRRLRRNPCLLEEVQRSLTIRQGLHRWPACLLESFVAKDAAARKALQDLTAYRELVNKKQASDKDKLKQLEMVCQVAESDLHAIIRCMPNFVDELVPMWDDNEESLEPQRQDQVLDPFFCIGGYEEVGSQCVMSGIGVDLCDLLRRSLIEQCRRQVCPDAQVLELPFGFPLGRQIAAAENCREDSSILASWLYLLDKAHAGKTYFDRSLPLCSILVCRGELLRTETQLQRPATKQPTAWYHRVATQAEMQLLILTGSSISADSRRLQVTIMEHLHSFYQQLVPNSHLTLRSIPPPQLDMAEASRIVLEGRIRTQILALATLSNYLDYHSNDIRHGSATDRRQGVHVLHGRLCHLNQCLEWIVSHSATNQGISLPPLLLHRSSLPMSQHIPYIRRIAIGKKGKRIVKIARGDDKGRSPSRMSKDQTTARPTPDETRLEATSCPFDFLPFYHR